MMSTQRLLVKHIMELLKGLKIFMPDLWNRHWWCNCRKREIYRGCFNSAGEFGHIITHANGKDCTCGSKGCYEVYASTTALVREAKEKLAIENVNGKKSFSILAKVTMR